MLVLSVHIGVPPFLREIIITSIIIIIIIIIFVSCLGFIVDCFGTMFGHLGLHTGTKGSFFTGTLSMKPLSHFTREIQSVDAEKLA